MYTSFPFRLKPVALAVLTYIAELRRAARIKAYEDKLK